MHEVHTARKIARMALVRARAQGHSALKAISVRVGVWTGIDAEHLQHDFKTVAPGVDLRIEVVQPSARCDDCGARFQPEKPTLTCSACGSRRVRLEQTKDIQLVDVESS